ncbi:hypothetical protein ACFYTG_32180 [Streptomyces mirabilis]
MSGSQQTLLGARDFATIHTSRATAERHGHNILDTLERAMRGRPWTPATA